MTVMRRAPSDATPYRYRVLPSNNDFDKNLSDLTSRGFSLVGVFTQRSGVAASLGRPGRLHAVLETSGSGTAVDTSVPGGRRFLVVSSTRTSTLEKELNQRTAEGYRLKGASLMNALVERVDSSSAKYTYRVIAAVRSTTLREEIQQAGREGYRVVPSAIMGNPGSKLETVVLMEHAPGSSHSYEYRFLIPSEGNMNGVRPVAGRLYGSLFENLVEQGFAAVGILANRSGLAAVEDELGTALSQPELEVENYFMLLEKVVTPRR